MTKGRTNWEVFSFEKLLLHANGHEPVVSLLRDSTCLPPLPPFLAWVMRTTAFAMGTISLF